MLKNFKRIIIPAICLAVIGSGLISYPAMAQTTQAADPPPATDAGGDKQKGVLQNPLGENMTNPTDLIGRIIFAILGLTGAIALVMFIWGGLQWMTAAGNAEKVTKGRDTLMWAVLGLVIIFSSYAILKAVLGILQ